MMGLKIPEPQPLPMDTSLEELVPTDCFYRTWRDVWTSPSCEKWSLLCTLAGGRPSVDPVVFFKLQLVMFFEDLRSERQLMEVAADRLSLRWYLDYDLFEPLPDHSSHHLRR